MTPESTLAESFGRAAPRYLNHARVQSEMADWLAEWLPADRSGRALEMGAGPGVFTGRLLPWRGELVASDISEAMCRAGRKGRPEVEWRTMSAEAPSGGPWDWIFSSSMLQWAADPAAVFEAWKRCLNPGGRILGGLFAAGSLIEWETLAATPAPLSWRSPAEWRGGLRRAGFRLLRDGSSVRRFEHGSAREFLRSLHRVGAAPARRFRTGELRRLLAEYERAFPGRSGVVATWSFYRFEAENPSSP